MRHTSRAPRPIGVAPRLAERIPDPLGLRHGEEELEAVLARVARAADQRGDVTEDRALGEAVVLDLREVGVGDLRQDVFRERPLQGEHGLIVRNVVDFDFERPGMLSKPRVIRLAAGRVDHHMDGLVVLLVDQRVVDDGSVLGADQRIANRALRDAGHVLREDMVRGRDGVGAPQDEPSHVAQIEQSAAVAHLMDLVLDAALVLHRHLEAGERNAARTVGLVPRGQGGLAKRFGHDRAA